MYARAVIKKRNGEKFTVEARAKCDIVGPTNIMDLGARVKYAFHTNRLLLDLYNKLKPYANQDHAIDSIQTDNLYLLNKFTDEGYRAEYLPDFEEEEEDEG